jgi:chemotaxis protein methyltransferase CheR
MWIIVRKAASWFKPREDVVGRVGDCEEALLGENGGLEADRVRRTHFLGHALESAAIGQPGTGSFARGSEELDVLESESGLAEGIGKQVVGQWTRRRDTFQLDDDRARLEGTDRYGEAPIAERFLEDDAGYLVVIGHFDAENGRLDPVPFHINRIYPTHARISCIELHLAPLFLGCPGIDTPLGPAYAFAGYPRPLRGKAGPKRMSDFLSDADFELFRKLIYDESGIAFSSTNRSILESRLKERLREKKLDNLRTYFSVITKDREELKTLLDSVTTNLTRFFRNQAHFDAVEKFIIPEMLKLRAASDRRLKFWSAGCSTGEEPYTIAMLLKRRLPPGWNFEVIASDISLKCLMVGKEGFYADTRVQGVPDGYLSSSFDRKPGGYQIKEEIKKNVRFDYHNLKNDSGLRNIDVVFCRNVLIYFDEAAQKATIERFWEVMAPKSFLFIGHSESLFGMNTRFEFVKTEWACFYRKNS